MGFFLKESLRALRRNAAPGLAAAMTVLITALVLGIFIPVVQAVTGKANEIRSRIQLEAVLVDDASRTQVVKLEREIKAMPSVESADYFSKEQNLKRLLKKEKDKSIVDLLPENPIPATLLIELEDPGQVDAVNDRLQPEKNGKRKPFSPLIEKVLNRADASRKILSATGTIKWLLGVLTAVLALASVLLVANTIRLSIFARRKEVEVMQLVGATNWFIRWPFVIEGIIVGTLGGVGAVVLLFIAKRTLVDPLSDKFVLIAAPDTINFPLLALILLAASIVVAAAGSGVTLRRFLRV